MEGDGVVLDVAVGVFQGRSTTTPFTRRAVRLNCGGRLPEFMVPILHERWGLAESFGGSGFTKALGPKAAERRRICTGGRRTSDGAKNAGLDLDALPSHELLSNMIGWNVMTVEAR